MSMSMSIKFFSVAKIAELLRSPQRRSRITIQNQEMIVEKEMFLDVDGKQVEMEMTECQLAVSSIGVMQRLERSVDRRLWAGMAAQAAAVTMRNEVGGDRVGWRRELAGSDRVALDRVIHKTPWEPPWSRPTVVDAASAELQGRLWHGRSGADETPDELQRWESTGVAVVDMPEARPGRNWNKCQQYIKLKQHRFYRATPC